MLANKIIGEQAGKAIKSTGATHRQQRLEEEELVEEDLFIEGKSLVDRFTESCEFDMLDGKVMKSTGSTHGQKDFGEEELVEDLFIQEKSMIDRSMESSEFERLDRKGMKSTGRTQGQEDFAEEELVLLYVRPPLHGQ